MMDLHFQPLRWIRLQVRQSSEVRIWTKRFMTSLTSILLVFSSIKRSTISTIEAILTLLCRVSTRRSLRLRIWLKEAWTKRFMDSLTRKFLVSTLKRDQRLHISAMVI
jgi:hypothetical protein